MTLGSLAKREIGIRATGPPMRRMEVKDTGSIDSLPSARRHNTELAANAVRVNDVKMMTTIV